MRMIHEKKCMRLKNLDERGAEAHKIESTRTLVRKLSTKIRIAFHFVDSISSKISKLRDEDLWPQIAQLIQGYVIHPLLLALELTFHCCCELSKIFHTLPNISYSSNASGTLEPLESSNIRNFEACDV